MRKVLDYPCIDRSKIDTVKYLIERIAESGNQNFQQDLQQLNRITGKTHTETEFFEYWGWTDLDALAEQALLPEPSCVRDLSREELQQIISVIKAAMLALDDHKAEYYIELLHKSLPLTDVQRYIRLEDDAETIVGNMLDAVARSVILL